MTFVAAIAGCATTDTGAQPIMIYDGDARALRSIRENQALQRPADVALSWRQRCVYVVDQFMRKVDVFRPAEPQREQGLTALPPQ